jgi:uncharacterized protein
MLDILSFGGSEFLAAGDAALFWPYHHILLVADLHLEKASSYAMNGQMLPPYDSHETLVQLSNIAKQHKAKRIICLGDNFHDVGGETRLGGTAADMLRQMTSTYDWTWITGNHDPHLAGIWGGKSVIEQAIDGIILRHQSHPNEQQNELSGHFHPKIRISLRGRNVSRRCFIQTSRKLIFPAFGAFTGGMDAAEAALIAQPSLKQVDTAQALISQGRRLLKFPLDINGKLPGAQAFSQARSV